jgi:hypothetical protein
LSLDALELQGQAIRLANSLSVVGVFSRTQRCPRWWRDPLLKTTISCGRQAAGSADGVMCPRPTCRHTLHCAVANFVAAMQSRCVCIAPSIQRTSHLIAGGPTALKLVLHSQVCVCVCVCVCVHVRMRLSYMTADVCLFVCGDQQLNNNLQIEQHAAGGCSPVRVPAGLVCERRCARPVRISCRAANARGDTQQIE